MTDGAPGSIIDHMLESGDVVSESRTIATSDGDLSYATAGTGPPVLAIQGVGVIGRGWRPQVAGLSAQFRFLTFDNRGLGRSPRGQRPLTIESMAADALAIADAERLDRFHVLGHSMGGLIALHLALTNRDRVKSLALLCTFADGGRATRPSGKVLVLALRSRIGTKAMRRKGMIRMIMPDAYTHRHDVAMLAQELGDLFGRDLSDQPPIIQHQLRAMSHYSAIARLHELSGIPTLVASASHDPIAPPALGQEIAARIDGARYVEFSDASHALPIQLAREVNALLLEHLVAAEAGHPGARDVEPGR
jgi:aminoacrylate hydrolase